MKFTQDWQPDYNYCIVCSKECENETCTSKCRWKLSKLRSAIQERKEEEKAGAKGWNMVSIRKFRTIQDTIGK